MWSFVAIIGVFFYCVIGVLSSDESFAKISLRMPEVTTSGPDSYLCTHIHLTETKHLTGFDPVADMHIAHHMLLFQCSSTLGSQGSYPCSMPCINSKIVYAWARQAPSLTLPNDVAFEAGPSTGYPYLVLQVHYLKQITKRDRSGVIIHTVAKPRPRVAGVMLMVADASGSIPAHAHDVRFFFGCKHAAKTQISPFAFRTHAHTLGRTIFAYQFPGGKTEGAALIGRASPQWPQAFYNSSSTAPIETGDVLLGACVYDSTHRNRVTHFGGTHNDEMCNFYMMYSRARTATPLSGDELEACGEGLMIPRKTFTRLMGHVPAWVLDYLPTTRTAPGKDGSGAKYGSSGAKEGSSGSKDSSWGAKDSSGAKDGSSGANDGSSGAKERAGTHPGAKAHPAAAHQRFRAVPWRLRYSGRLGQVSGVSIDSRGRLFVFHRGDRVWNVSAFDADDRLTQAFRRAPIAASTVLVVDRASGAVEAEFGADTFYMPHGIHVDANDDVWVTDVGLHQVMKLQGKRPVLTLGKAFEPGSDTSHFCKPTDVATFPNGDVFVADGYCNDRVLRFSRTGRLLAVLRSRHGHFVVPHSLARVNASRLCVADRERARVECFDAASGTSVTLLRDLPALGSAVYAISSDAGGRLLHGVTTQEDGGPKGFTYSWAARRVVARWGSSLRRPHDLAVAGDSLFVGEISEPPSVQAFRRAPAPKAIDDEDVDDDTRGAEPLPRRSPLPRNSTAYESKGFIELLSENSPMLVGVLIVLPLAIIVIGAMTVHLHRNGMCACLCRPRGGIRTDKERGRFEPLLNDESDTDDNDDILNIATMKRRVDRKA